MSWNFSEAMYPLSPLMHGTGMLIAIMAMGQGAPVVTSSGKKFEADEALDTIARHRVGSLVLVGDAFAIDSLPRAANGKPDYPFVTRYAEDQAKRAEA